MMVVDSFFILQFLFGHYHGAYGIQIKSDILKLENQIPLSVLKLVFSKVKIALLHSDLCYDIWYDACRVNRLLVEKAYNELCSFEINQMIYKLMAQLKGSLRIQHDGQDEREVDCIPKPTLRQQNSNFLQVHLVEKMCKMLFFSSYKPGDFPMKGYTTKELANAGIKFKSFSQRSDYI